MTEYHTYLMWSYEHNHTIKTLMILKEAFKEEGEDVYQFIAAPQMHIENIKFEGEVLIESPMFVAMPDYWEGR